MHAFDRRLLSERHVPSIIQRSITRGAILNAKELLQRFEKKHFLNGTCLGQPPQRLHGRARSDHVGESRSAGK
jgi:hypothetical protein